MYLFLKKAKILPFNISQRGGNGDIAQPFLKHRLWKGGGWSTLAPGRFTPRNSPSNNLRGGSPEIGNVFIGYGKSRRTAVRTPNRPSYSESLHRIRCTSFYTHKLTFVKKNIS